MIIDHDKVHQQIFINNKGKCVQIQIQKLKFVTTVKHLVVLFLLSFILIKTILHITTFFFIFFCYYPCLPYLFPMIDLFHFCFALSFCLCNDGVRLFFTIYRQRVSSLIHIYIYIFAIIKFWFSKFKRLQKHYEPPFEWKICQ